MPWRQGVARGHHQPRLSEKSHFREIGFWELKEREMELQLTKAGTEKEAGMRIQNTPAAALPVGG